MGSIVPGVVEENTYSTTKNRYSNSNIQVNDCDIDFSEMKGDLKNIFSSPNPLAIYNNTTVIQDKFAKFINCIGDKISSSFSLDNSWGFVFFIYNNSSYHHVWYNLSSEYIKQSKYFDLLSYFHFLFSLDKRLETKALAYFDIYTTKTIQETTKNTFESTGLDGDYVFRDYNKLFDGISLDIDPRADQLEHFMEKLAIAIKSDSKKYDSFLNDFSFIKTRYEIDFDKMVLVVWKIINSYSAGDDMKNTMKYIGNKQFSQIKKDIDTLVNDFIFVKKDFYKKADDIVSKAYKEQNIDKAIFWKYIKTSMIDKHFPELRKIFYFYSANQFQDFENWNNLKGKYVFKEDTLFVNITTRDEEPENISVSQEIVDSYKQNVENLIALKSLIIELDKNIFSVFINPMVYSAVSDTLNITRKNLHKLKYLLLYIFSDNYKEYKAVYMFFNQLEAFINFDKRMLLLERFKVGFPIFLVISIVLFGSYLYLPIGVFLGVIMFVIVHILGAIYSDVYARTRWNFGFKFFSVALIVLSSYFWFNNFENTKKDIETIVKKTEVLGTLNTREFVEKNIDLDQVYTSLGFGKILIKDKDLKIQEK